LITAVAYSVFFTPKHLPPIKSLIKHIVNILTRSGIKKFWWIIIPLMILLALFALTTFIGISLILY